MNRKQIVSEPLATAVCKPFSRTTCKSSLRPSFSGTPSSLIICLEICKAFDVKPEETLVLEDSANGVQAALAGNLPVINIPDLLPIPKEQQEKCVAVVENLKEVIPYI